MAQQTINVGTNPNDGTGDQNRSAWQKVNAMFTEIYATLTSLTSTQAAKAALTQVIRTDAAQSLTAVQRLQAAINGGTLIPLTAELVAPNVALVSGDYFAFTLPHAFTLFDTVLTVRDAGSGATINATLQKEESNGSWTIIHTNAGSIASRKLTIGTTAGGVAIPAGTSLRVNVTDVGYSYAEDTMGLAVWLRGVWA